MQPIIIIGSGMAGYTLAREYRKLNKEQPLVMICADDGVSYAKPTLSNALVANKHPSKIALADATKMAEQFNMQIINHTVVTNVDPVQKTLSFVKDTQTQVLDYQDVIFAVGATPIRLAIAGNASHHVFFINALSDYEIFRQQLDQKPQQHIAILGAGLIGCEFANDLQQTGHQTHVIDLAQKPLGRLLPTHAANLFQEKLSQSGIQFHLGTTVNEINAQENQYVLQLENGEEIVADLIICAIGLQANTELAHQAGLTTERGIVCNTFMQTNIEHIYALGDCAEVNGHFLPYVMPLMQQARALAKTLAGEQTAVHYPAMPVAVKTPAMPLTVLPAPHNITVTWQTEDLEDGLISQALDQTGTLRGFVLLGATAAKQRLSLTKLVPDLIPAQV